MSADRWGDMGEGKGAGAGRGDMERNMRVGSGAGGGGALTDGPHCALGAGGWLEGWGRGRKGTGRDVRFGGSGALMASVLVGGELGDWGGGERDREGCAFWWGEEEAPGLGAGGWGIWKRGRELGKGGNRGENVHVGRRDDDGPHALCAGGWGPLGNRGLGDMGD